MMRGKALVRARLIVAQHQAFVSGAASLGGLADRLLEQAEATDDEALAGDAHALIGEVAQWAELRGLDGLSLTTFAAVPWNAPYYARLGFTLVPESEWGSGIQSRVVQEAEQGLDAWPRVVMKRAAAVGGHPADVASRTTGAG